MRGHTWLVGVWIVLGSVFAACSWSSDRSAAPNGGAGHDASGTAGVFGTGGASGGGTAGVFGMAGHDAGIDTMSTTDTAPAMDGPMEKCMPIQCQTMGGNYCGTFPDHCGGLAMCGDCPKGQTCGTDHICTDPNCKPTVMCSGPGYQFCGTIGDGCNHALSCPDCMAPKTCGGGGTAHVCGM